MNAHLEQSAIKACAMACDAILKIRKKGFRTQTKADDSPVTEADEAANDIIQKILGKTGFPILSEESSIANFNIRKNWKELWIVDPLDGTKEFINGRDEYTVNIALVSNQKAVWGCIGIPEKNFIIVGGIGTNARKITYSDFNNSETCKEEPLIQMDSQEYFGVAVSRSHLSQKTRDFIKQLDAKNVKIMPIGSSLKFYLLANGEAHIYPRFSPCMEWDTASGHAIIKGSGMNLYDFETQKELLYNRENLKNGHFIAK